MNKNSIIVGIDLGTTNSVVGIYDAGTPRVIQNKNGSNTTPSVVAYADIPERGLNCIVGQLAKRQSVVNPENTFYSVKRLIGCKYNEIKNEVQRLSYKVHADQNDKIRIECPILKKDFSPEEISAIILKSLVDDAQTFLRQDVKKAVITVPAYFNDSQRLATKDAGLIAGLEVLRIINEPTAAALAYGLNKKKNEVVLIFDLGGGTFDVSILEVGNEVFEVLATSGDTHLGGDDFDHIIVNYILENFRKQHNIDLYNEKQSLQRVIEASELAKIALSSSDSTQINLPFIAFKNGAGISINLTLDRSKFENLSKELIDKCKKPVLQALEDAKLSKNDINEVVLVGGTTRIPAVKNMLRDLLGKSLNETVNPDEVVALGAAVQAGIIAGEITDLILLDVTPLSLGVEIMGGLMTPVIVKNTSVPVKQTGNFSTGSDNQDTVEIHVLQGERTLASDNKSLGIFKLSGIRPAPRGVPQINVTFQLDADGLLSVTAKDEESGKEQSIKIEGASTLDRNEVDKMIKDAESNVILDKILRNYTQVSYEMDNLFEEFEKLQSESISVLKSPTFEYLNSLLIELQNSYVFKNFTNIDLLFFKELEFVYNLYLQEVLINN